MLVYIPFIAIFSIVWCWELTDNGMIFEKLYLWLRDKLEEKHTWLYYPLIGCPKCNAGQFAFWFYLYKQWYSYSFFEHIFFITTTIFAAMLLMKLYTLIYERTKKD